VGKADRARRPAGPPGRGSYEPDNRSRGRWLSAVLLRAVNGAGWSVACCGESARQRHRARCRL